MNAGGAARRAILGVAGFAILLAVAPAPVQAQGRLDARFVATLAGLPVGRGAWVIDIQDDRFTAAASGQTAGLISVFSSGRGTSASQGIVADGQLIGTSYASTIVSGRTADDVRIQLSKGVVKDYIAEPPLNPNPDRIPIKDAHRRGVVDPMTAALMHVNGSGDTLVPEACARKLAIFDGRMRYDLQLSFKRMDSVKSDRGYQGRVVVCAVQFSPIAGHVPTRSTLKYVAQQRDIEAWLAPIAGTRVMVPYRMSIPTPLGLGVLQATQFVSIPHGARPATSNARTQ